jgi:hypothetical protein
VSFDGDCPILLDACRCRLNPNCHLRHLLFILGLSIQAGENEPCLLGPYLARWMLARDCHPPCLPRVSSASEATSRLKMDH